MTIIDSETVVVYNFDELKTVLEGDNTYNLIYFGSDIVLTGGISLRASKSNITIDGTYDNVRYTYTDFNSSSALQTIYLNSASSMNITVQNIDVIGRNYYGIICVFDASALSGVVVNYINVNYIGPQMAYNPYNSLNIIDCDVTIQTGFSPANEVAETRNVTLGGTVNINSLSTATSIFWFRYVVGGIYPFLRVLPNSNVSITGANTYLYFNNPAYVNMTFGDSSTTTITTSTGMGYTDTHRTSDVLIDNNASLIIEQLSRLGSNSTWSIIGEFKMNSGSSLKMVNNFTGLTTNRSLYFNSGASINLNNPRSLVLYNLSASAIYASANIPFNLNISQYNRWTTVTPYVSAGDINDIPTYSWYKLENINNLTVNGSITTTTTNITTTNLTPAEEAELPALSNFLLNNTRVLSIGRPSLTINPITDLSLEMSGNTAPFADIRINYLGSDYYTQADSNGDYLYTYSPSLPIGTEISFTANVAHSFLYRFRTIEIIYPGDLSINSATTQVLFSTTPFQTSPTLCQRSSPLAVTVEDSRITPTVWNLYASITHQLINEKGDILTDGLVFVDSSNNMTILSGTPTLVYTSDGITTGQIIVDWATDEGILLQLNVVPIVVKTTYRTDINWSIE